MGAAGAPSSARSTSSRADPLEASRPARHEDVARLAVITDLFGEEGARSVGVGEAMITELVTFASRAGCIGVDALALPGARAAKNFFEESGFTARIIVMHRPAG